MRQPISIANGARHYLWGGACDGWHLVEGDALSVIEERMPPGKSERRHRHAHARQFFYVLSGELLMELDGEDVRIGAGCGLEVAPGEWHTAQNRSTDDVRFLVISQPRAQGDREEDPEQ